MDVESYGYVKSNESETQTRFKKIINSFIKPLILVSFMWITIIFVLLCLCFIFLSLGSLFINKLC